MISYFNYLHPAHLITHLITYYQDKRVMSAAALQCPNCPRWFSSRRNLRRHITTCRSKDDLGSNEDDDVECKHPLQSMHHLSVPSRKRNSDNDYSDSSSGNLNDDGMLFDMPDHDDTSTNSSSNQSSTSSMLDDMSYSRGNNDSDHAAHVMEASTMLQIRLNDLINNHKASLKLHDDIVDIFNDYISSPTFDRNKKLIRRKTFMQRMENALHLRHLRPKNYNVQLQDKSFATVPVFDAKAMIMDLLSNPTVMQKSNFADGYDVLTGAVDENHPANKKYDEVHTGDAWIPARDRYCPPNDSDDKIINMPVGLIVFGDKSHTDLHGTLSLTPVTFTLTLFNRKFRNNSNAWRPLAYLPNLSYGKNKADKTKTSLKIQDEHTCLSIAFKSLREIHKNGGFNAVVMGKEVRVRVWIHYVIGDTEGNNKWMGHFPGNRKEICRPYRDCKCNYDQLSNPNPTCQYTTLDEMRNAKRLKIRNEKDGDMAFRNISRYDIDNAFTDLPLSDIVHGLNGLFPPELLHTSAAGMIVYMFESLRFHIGCGKARDNIDKQHIRMSAAIKRQSERDFPRGATRNGLVDGTKCQAEERRGNLFLLLCISQTVDGSTKLQTSLGYSQSKWKRWIKFLKLYLSMEEWFHDRNDKQEVIQARPMIASVLRMLQELFPREDGTNKYNIPKFHGLTKFQRYMMLFGSAMNFFGGPGEASHKYFVKAPGQKTQRRICEFAAQTATRLSEMMVTKHALRLIHCEESRLFQQGGQATQCYSLEEGLTISTDNDDLTIGLAGKYFLNVTADVLTKMQENRDIHVCWSTNKNKLKGKSNSYCLNKDLVKFLAMKLGSLAEGDLSSGYQVEGYTRAIIRAEDGTNTILYSHPCFQGNKWYDWAYVHFRECSSGGKEDDSYYPSRILGFISMNGSTEAVIWCSQKSLSWSDVEENFFCKIRLGQKFEVSVLTVPLSAVVHPLCVIPDYGSEDDSFIVVLPKRNWSRYFGDKITRV